MSYFEMFQRNQPLISVETQKKIKSLRLAIAGTGSTGGAFVDGALRLGISNYKLADNGTYELSNMNRQMVDLKAMNRNKALVYLEKIQAINPDNKIELFESGLTTENLSNFLENTDLVFDAVDVTTPAGMAMKLNLHERSAEMRLPVGSALDLAYCQWLKSYDYRISNHPLDGLLEQARKCKNPIKSLIEGFCPLDQMPLEILSEAERLLIDPQATSPAQLGTACFLLSSMVTPYILYFIEKNQLPPLIRVDLMEYFLDENEKKERYKTWDIKQKKISQLMKSIE